MQHPLAIQPSLSMLRPISTQPLPSMQSPWHGSHRTSCGINKCSTIALHSVYTSSSTITFHTEFPSSATIILHTASLKMQPSLFIQSPWQCYHRSPCHPYPWMENIAHSAPFTDVISRHGLKLKIIYTSRMQSL